MIQNGLWFAAVAGGFAVVGGGYSFFRAHSVALFLERQGIRSSRHGVLPRQVRWLGLFFFLAGVFFLFVASSGLYP